MLLLVKKRFADALRDGSKSIEVRAGARYRNIARGDWLSINGRFRLRVKRVDKCERMTDVLGSLSGRYGAAGMRDEHDARQSLLDCYGDHPGPFYLIHVS